MPTRYQVLVQEKVELVAKLRELNDQAVKDGLTDDEKDEREASFEKIEGVIADVSIELEREEKLQAYERSVAAVPDINQDNPDNRADEPEREYEPTFDTLGEQLQAIHRAADSGHGPIDSRLYAVATGMGENVPADGGFLVQQEQRNQIIDKVFSVGDLLGRVDRQPVGPGFNGVKLPAVDETSRADGSRWGGIRAYWLDEGAAKTASSPKIRLMDLRLKKLAALIYITDELLADRVALEAFVSSRVPLEINFKVEDAIINGTGGGQPEGILNANATVSVAKEGGQAANTVVWNNIKKMYSRMWARSRQNAAWFINQDIESQLFSMSETVGTGGVPVYLPANGAAGSPFATLMGRPVVPIEYCPTLGTVGDIIFADLSQYVLIDKGSVQAAQSMHVRFLNDEMAFRFVMRVDGQPMWNSALTPFKGTATQSPFITLATRA